jgi:aryl carrier-like protein
VGYRPRRTREGERRLVAYYTARAPLPPAELRAFLETTLPREMIPVAFVHLAAIPVAASGKVDRAALPQPSPERGLTSTQPVAPRTPVEATLLAIWREVLGVEALGVDDDYFALGGDSMRCIQIVTAARAHGLAIAPRDLFRHPTVAGLATVATRTDLVTPVRAASASAEEFAELLAEFGDASDGDTR